MAWADQYPAIVGKMDQQGVAALRLPVFNTENDLFANLDHFRTENTVQREGGGARCNEMERGQVQ